MNARLFALAGPPPRLRSTLLACFIAASCLHLALALSLRNGDAAPRIYPVTELELETIRPEPPPPPPPPPPAPPAAEPAPVKRAASRRAPDPPAVARAGAVLTAPETPEPQAEEPVRFVSDPAGRSYGTGIVARGGTADHGTGTTIAPPPPRPTEAVTPAERLRRQPMLIGEGCRGYFPASAASDQGVVSLIATVSSSGAITRLNVESESPEGDGFAAAARTCLGKRRFTPALDDRGLPAAARTRINLRFTRGLP